MRAVHGVASGLGLLGEDPFGTHHKEEANALTAVGGSQRLAGRGAKTPDIVWKCLSSLWV